MGCGGEWRPTSDCEPPLGTKYARKRKPFHFIWTVYNVGSVYCGHCLLCGQYTRWSSGNNREYTLLLHFVTSTNYGVSYAGSIPVRLDDRKRMPAHNWTCCIVAAWLSSPGVVVKASEIRSPPLNPTIRGSVHYHILFTNYGCLSDNDLSCAVSMLGALSQAGQRALFEALRIV
jgi:hypothetical protein